ncbi:class I SAM-dependent DNA methyltransferase [Azonexus sp.]|uniref:class I SAM-dependent DNA methyltransferase n=1 Tax=Azonexus sp. TaxID=1872668 RepID=UPI0039E55CFB
MTPEHFIATWKNNPLTERAGAQAHFDDLCDLLGLAKPRDPDNYCFERGAKKASGGEGWADVWKRGHFAWENKKPGRDLGAALKQLTDYALQLDNPPLLVVCDRERIVIHTAFTGYPDEPREILIDELIQPEKRQLLTWVFTDPEKLRPEKSTAAITAQAAGQFADLAKAMRERPAFAEHCGERVAHFLVQCLFCMFAEDEQLLPEGIFTGLLANAGGDAGKAARRIEKLFAAMRDKNGEYGDHDIAWFNGGLFKHIDVPPLAASDLAALHRAAAEMDWRAIDPTIFGTLFERGLDPTARAPLGAHYTDTGTIAKLIDPLIREPLLAEWQALKADIQAAQKLKKPGSKPAALYQGFLLRLNHFRVLDPACGSGNFLYLALRALRDVEKRVHVEGQELGLPVPLAMETGPHNILGLEINEFAAELARVTVWIGDIQWCRQNGYPHAHNPILRPLDGIEHRDALLNADGSEAAWPTADVVVGNPPFLGGSVMRGELGDAYVETLRKTYDGRVPGGADLVTYWFEKARAQIAAGVLRAAGLVSTNSIRGGANRKVLDRVLDSTRIFVAWSDEPWVNDGAAVRVSLVGFGFSDAVSGAVVDRAVADRAVADSAAATDGGRADSVSRASNCACPPPACRLDGRDVAAIHADLTAGEGLDLTKAKGLVENISVAFEGTKKYGNFEIPGEIARAWLSLPNPNGLSNSQVLRPWGNGQDVTKRPQDYWIIDFGVTMSEADASLFETPFLHVLQHVKHARSDPKWWLHERPRPQMREALRGLSRFILTVRVSKHRLFVWRNGGAIPDTAVVAIARADDLTFGILHSRFHELWSLRLGTSLEDRPRYTPTTTFETFPFPARMTPRDTAPKSGQAAPPCMAGDILAENIAAAARYLNQMRDNWLNPPEWVEWVITPEEEKAGFPQRPLAKSGHEAELKKRTLTNLYNVRPAWLDMAHQKLDAAVAAAYGWEDYTPAMPDDEILKRLLALNLERSAG